MSTVILVGAIPALGLLAVILGALGWAILTGGRETAQRTSRERVPTNVSHRLPRRSAPVTDAV